MVFVCFVNAFCSLVPFSSAMAYSGLGISYHMTILENLCMSSLILRLIIIIIIKRIRNLIVFLARFNGMGKRCYFDPA